MLGLDREAGKRQNQKQKERGSFHEVRIMVVNGMSLEKSCVHGGHTTQYQDHSTVAVASL